MLEVPSNMKKAILGTKVGMTQLFLEDGRVVPVTVVEAGPCTVVQKKTVERDGYSAIQVGFKTLQKGWRSRHPLSPRVPSGRCAEL